MSTKMKDFLRVADEARERRMFIAGYVAAIHDIERTGLQPFRDDTVERSARRAWETRGGA
jgi:hypothetical protein